MPQAVRELNALIHDLRGATAQLTASAKSTRTVVESVGPEVLGAVQRIHAIADSLANAANGLDKLIADNRQDLRSFTRDGLPELERFVREGRAAAEDISALASSLREDPSQLLYQPPERGMEIAR